MSSNIVKKNDGVYYVVVDGVPQNCQWQELKDYLRDYVKVTPGFANVMKVNQDGTRVGCCPLRNKADANRAYEYLVAEGWKGLDIRVSMIWKPDLNSDQIERKRGPEASRRKRAPIRPLGPGHMAQVLYQQMQMQMQMSMPLRPPQVMQPPMSMHPMPQMSVMQPYHMGGMMQEINNMTPQSFSPNTMPVMRQPEMIMPRPQMLECIPSPHVEQWMSCQPIRLPPPCAVPERTEIHMTRLPHDMKHSELRTILSAFGEVIHMHIKKGKTKDDKRTSATAKFDAPTEAARAIHHLHGRRMGTQLIEVKYNRSEKSTIVLPAPSVSRTSDSDHSPVRALSKHVSTTSGPLVVDGRGPRRRTDKTYKK